jgi:protein AATF/BFR2
VVFANKTCLDFDPEDEENGNQGSEDGSGSEVDENAGREHYEKVG